MRLLTALALTFAVPAPPAHLVRAASFDCAKARVADEKAICANAP
jgi:uncharacterized protein